MRARVGVRRCVRGPVAARREGTRWEERSESAERHGVHPTGGVASIGREHGESFTSVQRCAVGAAPTATTGCAVSATWTAGGRSTAASGPDTDRANLTDTAYACTRSSRGGSGSRHGRSVGRIRVAANAVWAERKGPMRGSGSRGRMRASATPATTTRRPARVGDRGAACGAGVVARGCGGAGRVVGVGG